MANQEERQAFGGGVAVITGAGAGIGEGLARYAAMELDMTVEMVLASMAARGDQLRDRRAPQVRWPKNPRG